MGRIGAPSACANTLPDGTFRLMERLDQAMTCGHRVCQYLSALVLGRAQERFERTDRSARILLHLFSYLRQNFYYGQPAAFGHRKNFDADKKRDKRGCTQMLRTMVRSGKIPSGSGFSLDFHGTNPDTIRERLRYEGGTFRLSAAKVLLPCSRRVRRVPRGRQARMTPRT